VRTAKSYAPSPLGLSHLTFEANDQPGPFDLYEREDGVVLAVLVLVVAHTVGKTGRYESGNQKKGPKQGVAGLVV